MMKYPVLPLAIAFSAAIFHTHCTDQKSAADSDAGSSVQMVPVAYNTLTPPPSEAVKPTEPSELMMVPVTPSSKDIEFLSTVQPIDIGEPLEIKEFPGDRPSQVIEIGKPLNADDPNTMLLGLPDQAPIEIGRPLDVEDASVNTLTESQQATIEIGEPLDIDLSEAQVVGPRSSPIIGPSPNGGVSVIRPGESDQVRP